MMRTSRSIASVVLLLLAACADDGTSREESDDALRGSVASQQDAPSAVAADASDVFWVTADGVYKRERGSRTPAVRLASTTSGTSALVLDATHVYWVTGSGDVMKVAKQGGVAESLAAVESHRGATLVVDGNSALLVGTSESLSRVPKAGGAKSVLESGGFLSLAQDATELYFQRQTQPWGERAIFSMPKGGTFAGSARRLATFDGGAIAGPVVDATHVYFTHRDLATNRQRVAKIDKATGTRSEMPDAQTAGGARVAALDGDVVCFADFDGVSCQTTAGSAAKRVVSARGLDAVTLEGRTLFFTRKGIDTRWLVPFDMMPADVSGTGAVSRLSLPAL